MFSSTIGTGAAAPLGAPAPPTGLTAEPGYDPSVRLIWDDPADNSITGYEYRLEAELAKLVAVDGDVGDLFGISVALEAGLEAAQDAIAGEVEVPGLGPADVLP